MKREITKTISTLALLVAASQAIFAQDVNGRASLEADWKAFKGFHITAGYEARSQDAFSGIERNQFSLGASYKLSKHFKAGLDYIFIGHYGNSSGEFKPRHRLSANLTGTVDAGLWRFSLKEKLQLTHKAYDVNRYQEVLNPLTLKSRLTVKYRGLNAVEPYLYAEVRNIFNAPRCSATYNSATDKWSDYEFLGYDHAYVNRVRGAVGLEWKLSKSHSLDFTAMYNFHHELEIDTNSSGSKLKSYGWESPQTLTLCVGYKFSF
ncbi:MAG: DUF2490 domain-containing protein [Bacteroidia bacterium]|nr:DUF2490 domain-containing protein [Bacteroidia bacterium]